MEGKAIQHHTRKAEPPVRFMQIRWQLGKLEEEKLNGHRTGASAQANRHHGHARRLAPSLTTRARLRACECMQSCTRLAHLPVSDEAVGSAVLRRARLVRVLQARLLDVRRLTNSTTYFI